MRSYVDCGYQHPQFGACDDGMIYGAEWSEDEQRWVPVDFLCPACSK